MSINIGSGNGLQPDSQHEVVNWSNADFSLVGFRDFRMTAIPQWATKLMSVKIVFWKITTSPRNRSVNWQITSLDM